MKPVTTFVVTPSLPPELAPLRTLAYNLRWAWNHETIDLFRRLDSDLWEESGHNPVSMLGTIEQDRLEAVASDEGFWAQMDRVAQDVDDYMAAKSTWFERALNGDDAPQVTYFSAEFGVTECLSILQEVQAQLQRGDLTPEDVSVELYVGPVSPGDEIVDAKVFSLTFQETLDEGVYLYEAETVACEKSGLFGYTVRVLPNHPDLVTPFIPGLITWA